MRRPSPLYLLAAILAVATIVFAVATVGSSPAGTGRTGSVYDDGPGGAAALRRYLEAMGATTTTLQGDRYVPEVSAASVLFILGATEAFTPTDAANVKAFVAAGGTAVVATDLGLLERSLLDAFGIQITGIASPGTHALRTAAFADPPARTLAVDRVGSLSLGPKALSLATDGRTSIAAAVREGRGTFYVVASLFPFLASGLGQGDNARVALALAHDAVARGGTVAFDEYHHGAHPSADVLVLLQTTWPGRALVFAFAAAFLYLVLSGRRLGPPVPLDARPARSSLEYIRGFAGLVRRSGRGEIARRRLRRDLRGGLARALGLDPGQDFDRVLATLAATDRQRAAEARAVDDALGRRLREDQLLRTVAQIERLTTIR
ncbi:MAG TPA: DUF4350 domain-containing protein [Candidatus Limnocylindria bacterium]|nr:DUF4350 domain-containing protein [Candidatus Limnocylindria bacterium]